MFLCFQTIRMQQQRLTDLKKTLQRELKVQTLPNDDQPLSDSESVRPLGRTLAESRSHSAVSLNHASSNSSAPHSVSSSRTTPSLLYTNSAKISIDATLMGSAGQSLMVHNAASNNTGGHKKRKPPFNAKGEYDHTQDLNLEYLKHVVLKFMLSREAEVRLHKMGAFISRRTLRTI